MDHDYSSETDHAQYRQYGYGTGRWFSPDPYSGSYDFTNPQSLNRYSYVLNNPVRFNDPSGQFTNGEKCGFLCEIFEEGMETTFDAIGGALGDIFGFGPQFHGSLQPRPDIATQPYQLGNNTFYVDVYGLSLPSPALLPHISFSLGSFSSDATNNIPTTQTVNSQLISQANTAFNQCVQGGALAAVGTGAAQSVFQKNTSTGNMAVNAGSNALDHQEECLSKNPLAALSPNYKGIVKPGDIGAFLGGSNYFNNRTSWREAKE